MPSNPMSEVIQHLRRAVLLLDGAGLTDEQLLEDYISRREEAALAALVQRHAPMVWGVCRRVLANYHDAEDAFQATFLVLVRKAASIASRELFANWLYGVAHQTALKARATAAKRKVRERQVMMPEPAASEPDLWSDLQPLLDAELSRLPDKYRSVIVLCDLEGKTRNEAARQLGWPEGTVAGRLARARAMLAKRLTQRGVVLSSGALAVVLSQSAESACVPPSVVSSTIKAASLFAAGQAAATGLISFKVAVLTEGVLKAMLLTKLKIATAVLLVVAALVGGAGLIYQTQAAEGAKGLSDTKTAPSEGRPNEGLTTDNVNDKLRKALLATVFLDIEYANTLEHGSALGVVVDRRGYLLTVYAPLKGATKVRAAFSDGRILDVPEIKGGGDTGLALVRLEKALPKNQRLVRFADPGSGKVGEAVWVIRKPDKGNKSNLILKQGIVDGWNGEIRLEGKRTLQGLLEVDQQVDAGSPVLNSNGELVGLAIVAAHFGYALPSNTVEDGCNNLR